jgi:hypothetical protein
LLRNAFKYIRACLLETNARACPLLVANARARPGNPATRQPGNPATRQPGDPATRQPGAGLRISVFYFEVLSSLVLSFRLFIS